MNFASGFFVAFLMASTLFAIKANGDEEANNNNMDVKQSLDEISKEVNEMKARLTSNNDMRSETDSNNNATNPRAVVSEIEKIKKIAEILETIILPTIVNSQTNEQKQNQINHGTAANSGGELIKPKLLQHQNILDRIF